MRRWIVVLVCVVSAAAMIDGAGRLSAQVASSDQRIDVDVTVTDSEGRVVTDLTRDDFEVREDGVAQAIDALEVPPSGGPGGVPVSKPETGPARNDYVIVFDSGNAFYQREVANAFLLQAVRPGDRVAVVETGVGLPAELAFSADPTDMVDAVRRAPASSRESASAESFRLLRDLIARLRTIDDGRPSILFITSGSRYLQYGVPPRPSTVPALPMAIVASTRRAFEEAARMATMARIPVHTAAPVGLDRDEAAIRTPPADPSIWRWWNEPVGEMPPETPRIDPSKSVSAHMDYTDYQTRSYSPGSFAPPGAGRHSSVRLMSEVSGGTELFSTVPSRLPPMLAAGSARTLGIKNVKGDVKPLAGLRTIRYVLSYTSSANQRDGSYHRIEISVKRPGLKVAARPGYYAFGAGPSTTGAVAIPDDVSPRARAVIESAPVANVSAAALAAALGVAQPSADVLVGLQVENARQRFDVSRPIEVVWSAIGDEGYGALAAVERRLVQMKTSDAGSSQATLAEFSRLELPEGNYRITGVVSQDGAGMAVAQTFVTVASRSNEPYGFTDVVLSSSLDRERDVTVEHEELLRLLPNAPAIRRAFSRAATLSVATEFYDLSDAFDKVKILATVTAPRAGLGAPLRSEQKVDFRKAKPSSVTPNAARPGRRVQYTSTVPLSKLQPGSYTLTLEATGSGARSAKVVRQVAFTVE